MYTIEKKACSERERTWLLFIGGHQMGTVEIIHMTDTLRSLAGQFVAFTTDYEEIKVTYDCDKAIHRVSYSINHFINDIQDAIKGRELHIPRAISEDAPEQIYMTSDVTEDNVDSVVEMLRIDTPKGWNMQSLWQKVGYVQTYLREEKEENIACPMRNLVQQSKLAKTRATPVHIHMKNMF